MFLSAFSLEGGCRSSSVRLPSGLWGALRFRSSRRFDASLGKSLESWKENRNPNTTSVLRFQPSQPKRNLSSRGFWQCLLRSSSALPLESTHLVGTSRESSLPVNCSLYFSRTPADA